MSQMSVFLKKLEGGHFRDSFEKLYPNDKESVHKKRFESLAEGYIKVFKSPINPVRVFSAPGRTEIGGNHTDHQNGNVLAAAVSLDAVCIASINNTEIINIMSQGFGIESIDLSNLTPQEDEKGKTSSLIRGISARLLDLGYAIGGFDAFISSNVPPGSGLSSSACYENLVTTTFNFLFNNGSINPIVVAQIGQYAENVYFGKPSGLMDQMASSVGGVVSIDFADSNNPIVKEVSFDLSEFDYSLCIVNTFSDHADLTDDYSDITVEMKSVAEFFGKEKLSEIPSEEFYSKLPEIRKQVNDRALLRAIHFYSDNKRVPQQVKALELRDFSGFKKLVRESGVSSFTCLQNVFSPSDPKNQGLSLALALSEHLLAPLDGAWRVHGGGFAGTIQAFVPNSFREEYSQYMDRVFGKNACYTLSIRPVGGIEILPK